MRTSLVENFERQRAYYESNGIVSSIIREGAWKLRSGEFTFVDQESQSHGGHNWYRFFFRPLHDALWLYGKISGHRPQAYDQAVEIVEGLKPAEESIG